jgi:hypothetical protein
VSALGTLHATTPLHTVVRQHRTAAATSSMPDASAHTLEATSKLSVGHPAANLHSSAQAGREERKPRSAPPSRLNTRPSAEAVSTIEQKGIVLNETAQLDLSHSADAVSPIGDDKLRIHIDQGTTGVESNHSDDTLKHGARGNSRQTRKSLDWGAPPPFDKEDEKLAKLYKAQRREQAAARAAKARDKVTKGQQSSVVNSVSAGSSTSLRGSSLEFKPAPASPRLCISTPNDVVQEETKTASRGGAGSASRRSERSNLAQV